MEYSKFLTGPKFTRIHILRNTDRYVIQKNKASKKHKNFVGKNILDHAYFY
jgi:hypothetical protein